VKTRKCSRGGWGGACRGAARRGADSTAPAALAGPSGLRAAQGAVGIAGKGLRQRRKVRGGSCRAVIDLFLSGAQGSDGEPHARGAEVRVVIAEQGVAPASELEAHFLVGRPGPGETVVVELRISPAADDPILPGPGGGAIQDPAAGGATQGSHRTVGRTLEVHLLSRAAGGFM